MGHHRRRLEPLHGHRWRRVGILLAPDDPRGDREVQFIDDIRIEEQPQATAELTADCLSGTSTFTLAMTQPPLR